MCQIESRGTDELITTDEFFFFLTKALKCASHSKYKSIFKPGYLFLNTSEADVCNHFVLIGQLLAVCDVSSGSGISGKEGDLFWLCSTVTEFKLKPCVLSASPLEARPAHVW